MKANEFVKKFGWEESKKHLLEVREAVNQTPYKHSAEDFSNDLKRLIESHELVKEHGSLGGAKEYADSVYTAPEVAERLHAAIADVESCMEGV